MMEAHKTGKVISINGPSFSGKTTFVNYLLKNLTSSLKNKKISVVSFESAYKKDFTYDMMLEFFKDNISEKLCVYDIILCESTVVVPFEDVFKVLIYPDETTHKDFMLSYMNRFGKYDTLRRGRYFDTNLIRKEFANLYNFNNADMIVSSSDYESYLERIKQYASS